MSSIAIPHVPAAPPRRGLTTWQTWGLILIAPYAIVFLAFVLYPVSYGLWLARHPESYVKLFADPIFIRTAVNTVFFLLIAVNLKFLLALWLSGFFVHERTWIRWMSVIFLLPWAVPSIPTIFSIRFMFNPEWGVVNSTIFRLTALDGPNWLNDPHIGLGLAMLTHIWKSLPFWTLILIAGRLAIPREQYEAAAVDGASTWQKFKYVTWPSLRTLYLSSTILSMIWSLGDFNSVYLLTGGGPADLTHVLATLGIRYIRLDQVDLAMATIVCAMPLVLPLVYFMMKNLSRRMKKLYKEGFLILMAIPILLWTLIPIYHIFLFSISSKDSAFSGALWPDKPTLRNFEMIAQQHHFYLNHFWIQIWNSLWIAVAVGRDHARGGDLCCICNQPIESQRRARGDEPRALHLLHPGGVPRDPDVQGDGHVRPAEQPLVAGARDGDARLALRDLGAEAGLRQAALRARRSGEDRRRDAAAALPPGLPAADDAFAHRHRHLRPAARLERVPLRLPAPVARAARSRSRSRSATSSPRTIRPGSC